MFGGPRGCQTCFYPTGIEGWLAMKKKNNRLIAFFLTLAKMYWYNG